MHYYQWSHVYATKNINWNVYSFCFFYFFIIRHVILCTMYILVSTYFYSLFVFLTKSPRTNEVFYIFLENTFDGSKKNIKKMRAIPISRLWPRRLPREVIHIFKKFLKITWGSRVQCCSKKSFLIDDIVELPIKKRL